tara:strand:+ start:4715 stop:5776 length:1062 start_codon:yes stop_codon:yes gene_type:complete
MKPRLSLPLLLLGLISGPTLSFADQAVTVYMDSEASNIQAVISEAEAGSPWALFDLGSWYYEGIHGFEKNDRRAFNAMSAAYSFGHPLAAEYLADMYWNARGVNRNPEKTAKLLAAYVRKKKEPAYAKTHALIGMMYAIGKGLPQNEKQAAAWFNKAKEQGYDQMELDLLENEPSVCYNLGRYYYEHENSPEDVDKAAMLLHKAEVRNHTEAALLLGDIYYEKGDFQNAAPLYLKSAMDGHPEAQYKAAQAYYYGDGFPQDYSAAFLWAYEAARQNHAKSQNLLGLLYGLGEGPKKDIIEAYAWANLAVFNGEDSQIKDNIEGNLYPDQIKEGQIRSRSIWEELDGDGITFVE